MIRQLGNVQTFLAIVLFVICFTKMRYYCIGRAFCLRSQTGRTYRKMSTTSAGAATDEVLLERTGNKGIITLNRPKALHSLSLSMVKKIYPQLKSWEMDNTMKMVLIKATGDKAFCAGGDVKTIAQSGKGSAITDEFFREEYRMNNIIGSLAIPYVSLINGIVMGGGVGISVHGPFRVVTEKAVFAMPETAIGFFPDVGASHFLPRLPGKLGLFLGLTGHRLTGRDIVKAGVGTHFVPSDRLNELEKDLIRLEAPDIHSIDKILTKYSEQWEQDFKKEFSLKQYIGRINSAFGGQSVEEIVENLKKDNSEWSKQQLDIMSRMSPMSLKLTYEELRRGHNLTLPECLKMEFRISQHCMANEDFFTGVTHLLVNKSKEPPVWKHRTLEEISAQEVDSYFQPLTAPHLFGI
ncbi:unnamed protein product [Medioppia subpectinata]|uniref:3-hydroxyisobutyryl-CoA hydrolase, mitochondrial n=1 Tax=Medioppia subpectinata TaxID=1979941 RepID=A0A7R9KKY9_9ACAR|nr:unnamed protein product [Medioppia subpectinata]CAG2105580.1 unnamed protein product [Medioppia subpectinata]